MSKPIGLRGLKIEYLNCGEQIRVEGVVDFYKTRWHNIVTGERGNFSITGQDRRKIALEQIEKANRGRANSDARR